MKGDRSLKVLSIFLHNLTSFYTCLISSNLVDSLGSQLCTLNSHVSPVTSHNF